jgi:hypothetical protein
MSQKTFIPLHERRSVRHTPRRHKALSMPSSEHLELLHFCISHDGPFSPLGTAPQLQQSSDNSQSLSYLHSPAGLPVVASLLVPSVLDGSFVVLDPFVALASVVISGEALLLDPPSVGSTLFVVLMSCPVEPASCPPVVLKGPAGVHEVRQTTEKISL